MSGGSYGYAYFKVSEMADQLVHQEGNSEERVKFGKHLQKVAKAMKAIEWVDSGDWDFPQELDAIKKVMADLK